MMWSAVCSGTPHSQAAQTVRQPSLLHGCSVPSTDRPQFAECLESSSVFDSNLLPCRLLLGPIRGDVLGWVRMFPTPVSTLPQSMPPSTDPQGWHLASTEPPCCKVYWTWVCKEVRHPRWCRACCSSRVSLLPVPRRGWLLFALGRQVLSLLRQGAETQVSGWDNPIWFVESFWLRHQQYSAAGNTKACVEIRSVLAEAPHVVPARRPMSDSLYICDISCHLFKVLLEVQNPV